MTSFFQTPPRLQNAYTSDSVLKSVLKRRLPPDVLEAIEPGLMSLGDRTVTEMPSLAAAAESQPPVHVPFDPWGRRIDEIQVSDAWKQMHRIAAEEGIVATAYERAHGPYSRIHQLVRLYLYHPSSAIYSCPLAMTDGAARVLELLGPQDLQERAFSRLISRDPQEFWTSGQWMTERTGGSDVGKSLTRAEPGDRDGIWRLYGNKWFTSAVTSDMTLTLARMDDRIPGTRGLSLFYVELRRSDGTLNGIRVLRLKDKLGTRALPTAELDLVGTEARLLGDHGHGLRKIAPLLNITRTYNAVCALGTMRRGIALARDYATRREAFGKRLSEQPLHLETLAALQTELEAGMQLTMRLAELLGREECGDATDSEQALLRILTPLAKLFTGKQVVRVCSEVLECFGGAGYVEDTGLPQLLRDGQVLPIWEGTTNILSLDVLRAGDREGALGPLLDDCRRMLSELTPRCEARHLAPALRSARDAVARITEFVRRIPDLDPDQIHLAARTLALGLASTYSGLLLLDQAVWSHEHETSAAADRSTAARRWCRRRLFEFDDASLQELPDTQRLAMTGDG